MLLRGFVRYGESGAFAARCGISPQLLSAYMHGKRTPSFAVALRIAELTDGAVSLEELLGLEGRIPACVRLRAADPQVEPPATPKASPSRATAEKRQPDIEEYLDRVECESSGTNPDDPVKRAEARRRRLARVGRAA